MAPLADISIDRTKDGRNLLRFSTKIVNTGTGPFELSATRSSSTSTFSASQRIYNDDGTSSDSPTPGVQFVFAGDGHTHWHIRDLESYELDLPDNGVRVGTGVKSGFCFWDNSAHQLSLPGAPATAQYLGSGCGTESSLNLRMGLSVGWGDV